MRTSLGGSTGFHGILANRERVQDPPSLLGNNPDREGQKEVSVHDDEGEAGILQGEIIISDI